VPEVASWSLRRRLATVIGLIAAVLAGLIVVAVVVLTQVRAEQRTVINRYFTAVSVSNVRYTDQVDAETAIRGYALTGDRATLEPLRLIRSATYGEQAVRIKSLLHDSPSLAALTTWNQAILAWYQQWAVPTIAEVKSGGRDSVSAQQVLAGKALFDHNRAAYGTFSTRLVAKRNAASHSLQLRTTLLFGAVLLVTIGVLLAGVASWWGLRRWIIDPLAELGTETRLVTSGAIDHQVGVRGPMEVRDRRPAGCGRAGPPADRGIAATT
jgi:CHASE3 domain sensor protein